MLVAGMFSGMNLLKTNNSGRKIMYTMQGNKLVWRILYKNPANFASPLFTKGVRRILMVHRIL
jgi:hypothetical protein